MAHVLSVHSRNRARFGALGGEWGTEASPAVPHSMQRLWWSVGRRPAPQKLAVEFSGAFGGPDEVCDQLQSSPAAALGMELRGPDGTMHQRARSEEHTSELQSRQ